MKKIQFFKWEPPFSTVKYVKDTFYENVDNLPNSKIERGVFQLLKY